MCEPSEKNFIKKPPPPPTKLNTAKEKLYKKTATYSLSLLDKTGKHNHIDAILIANSVRKKERLI